MKVQTVAWQGTGIAKNIDLGTGWGTPMFILVRSRATGSGRYCAVWWSSFPVGMSAQGFNVTSNLYDDAITEVGADYFRVATNVNVNANTSEWYDALVIADNGADNIACGTYDGNSSEGHVIDRLSEGAPNPDISFDPALLMTFVYSGASSGVIYIKTIDMPTGGTNSSTNGASWVSHALETLGTKSFTVGNATNAANTTGVTYCFVILGALSDVFKTGKYDSPTSNPDNIATTLNPAAVFVKNSTTTVGVWACNLCAAGDTKMLNNTAKVANAVTALGTGQFTHADHASVHYAASGRSFYWWAFAEAADDIVVYKTATESGVASEAGSVAYSPTATDEAVASESSEVAIPVASDDRTATDEAGLSVVHAVEDSAVAAEAAGLAGLVAAYEVSDSAVASEHGRVVVVMERHVKSATIDSNLENLCDAYELTIVEQDPDSPTEPTQQAWHLLREGNELEVRLGLADVGMYDYGTCRVDQASLQHDGTKLGTAVNGRDLGALLVEARAIANYRWVIGDEEKPEEWDRPSARYLTSVLASRVGLSVVWDTDDYWLDSFTLDAESSLADALSSILSPLQVSRRYRTDAWVSGRTLYVRRRGRGSVKGTLDCGPGMVTEVRRAQEPSFGPIDVYGGTYAEQTYLSLLEKRAAAGNSEARATEDSPTHRVVETGIMQGGSYVVCTRETEDMTYEDVFGDPPGIGEPMPWLGRVQTGSRVLEEKNLHTSNPTAALKETDFGYDLQWRLVHRDERSASYNSLGQLVYNKHVVTRMEQVTPTDVRTVTIELSIDSLGNERVKSGYPKWEQQPGTLQSSIRVEQDRDAGWGAQQDGSTPDERKAEEETGRYHHQAWGPGTLPREYRNDQLSSATEHRGYSAICETIAHDLASESGAFCCEATLRWARPFPYKKGDLVALTNILPGIADVASALITSINTTYDEDSATWEHVVNLEWWEDDE